MNDESREEKKIFEILTKNRLLFVLVGAIIAIIAFFMPMYYSGGISEHDGNFYMNALFLFGLFVDSVNETTTWMYVYERQEETYVSMISSISTSIIGFLIVGTIVIVGYFLIRKRKEGVYSSRLFLFPPFGLLTTVVGYLLAVDFAAFENTQFFDWLGGNLYAWSTPIGIGTILFVISSCMMLAGYTLKARPLLRLFSLVVAVLVCYNSVLYLQRFLYYESSWISTPPPDVLLGNLTEHLVPGIVLLSVTLVITVVNLIIQLKVRKKRKRDSLE